MFPNNLLQIIRQMRRSLASGLMLGVFSMAMGVLPTTGASYPSGAQGSSTPLASMPSTSAKCVIICPVILQNEANALKSFHGSENIASEVITTETIRANYAAAEDPPFTGYKNRAFKGWKRIKNYDYVLARKIIAYLRDDHAHPSLSYVTIFGDALLVPPSYYYSLKGGSYDDWVPTDFFYASPDYDFVPNFKIGRLPVHNTAEASALVHKIINWHATADWSWFKKAYFVGGRTDAGPSYWGEFVPISLINQNVFSGMEIHKCFHSDGNFTKSCLEPALSTTDAGFVFISAHGAGDNFRLDDSKASLLARDVMAYAPYSKVPIVVSPTCYGGAFDSDLAPGKYHPSIGEALLKSPAGGIAYFGGSRFNTGADHHHYDQGRFTLTKVWGITGFLINVFRSYHNLKDTLGDLYFDAVDSYVLNNNMAEDVRLHLGQLFMFVLLGDPALKIPVQQPLKEYDQASCVAVSPARYDADNIPLHSTPPVTITATTNSPTVRWKLFNYNTDAVLDYTPPTSNLTYTTGNLNPGLYIMRVATEATVSSPDYGKEGWLYFSVGQPPKLMFVSDISIAIQTDAKRKTKKALATITVGNNSGSFVPRVLVSGHWSGPATNTASGKTNSHGQVVLSSDSVSITAPGTFNFCLDDATLAGWFFDKGASSELCDQSGTSSQNCGNPAASKHIP